jgi:hypothetical protein
VKVGEVLDHIDLGAIALPQFQRGYVWNRAQVRGLMDSLYRSYPVGSLLVWVTKSEAAVARGDAELQPGFVQLLLDGQQRMTSLYGIVRGKPPEFFDGKQEAFTGLHFNLQSETFEFHAPLKMKDDPFWVDVTAVMAENGVGEALARLMALPEVAADAQQYLGRLMRLANIKEIDFHIDSVTGEERTLDVVVDIFNRVNSGGTKLSKGDLALAKICAEWADARDEMKKRLAKWRRAGFEFSLDWLLRNINAIITGRAEFSALEGITPVEFRQGLMDAEKGIDKILNLIAGRLGLDHGSVLAGWAAFPVMARFLADRGFKGLNAMERDRLLYWYVHTFLWGRYAGSTETVLNRDLQVLERAGIDGLINEIASTRGDLRVRPIDFVAWSRGARFYPLLYMLTRVNHARDWGNGLELHHQLLGYQSSLELHHIFPKARLYPAEYSRPEVNSLANFAFLTMETNREVTDRLPEEYLPAYEAKHPGAIVSHWIPQDSDLWRVERYRDFLTARRELLAKAANDFLDELIAGIAGEAEPEDPQSDPLLVERPPVDVVIDEEERTLRECQDWIVGVGFAEGEENYDLVDDLTGKSRAILDLAWPEGLQTGLTEPVAVLLDETPEVEAAAGAAGFRFFTDLSEFRAYVERDLLVEGSREETKAA